MYTIRYYMCNCQNYRSCNYTWKDLSRILARYPVIQKTGEVIAGSMYGWGASFDNRDDAVAFKLAFEGDLKRLHRNIFRIVIVKVSKPQ